MSFKEEIKKSFDTDKLKASLAEGNEKSKLNQQKFDESLKDGSNPLSKWWVRLIILVIILAIIRALLHIS